MSCRSFLVAAMCLAFVTGLGAKGPTVRLVIAGAGLTKPITVTDASVMTDSNVFGDSFLGPLASSSSINPTWPKYEISFYVDLPSWMHQGVQKKYVVYYTKHPRTGEGFVYLPGPGEEWYGLNASTILRNGLEGNWLRASQGWAKALNTHLP